MRVLLVTIVWLACTARLMADADRCAVCGGELTGTVYLLTDKVTNEKKQICQKCSTLTETCFICGLPVKTNLTTLPDGRVLCARDSQDSVLNEDEAKVVCAEVKDALDRLFSRFMTFPGTNVETAIVDRVHILQLFKVPGNDFQCPMVLGYIRSKPDRGHIHHEMSLLSALRRAEFKAVCAHEFTHAWQAENISEQRRPTLGHDAVEGFCELIAWILMDSQHEEDEIKAILRNKYTRGQIDLFIEAQNRFGLNEVIEWMKYGVDAVLDKNDVNNVRRIQIPSRATDAGSELSRLPAPAAPEALILKGISWTKEHPLALINDRTFATSERGRVHIGTSNVVLQCLQIGTNSAVVQVEGAADSQLLVLPGE